MKQALKFILITLALCVAVINYSNAQLTKESLKNATPQQRAKLLTDTMNTILKFNKDQYASVYNVNLDIANKNAVILKSDAGKFSKFKKIKANQDVRDDALKKVLSKNQFDLYKQKENEIISIMKSRAGNTHS